MGFNKEVEIHPETEKVAHHRDFIRGVENALDKHQRALDKFASKCGYTAHDFRERAKNVLRNFSFTICFFILNAIFLGKKASKSKWVFFVLPPQIKGEGNIFYDFLIDIIVNTVNLSGVCSVIRPLVNSNSKHFDCHDKVHLSDFGSSRKMFAFQHLAQILKENIIKNKNQHFPHMAEKFNIWLEEQDEHDVITTKRSVDYPVRSQKPFGIFERDNYPKMQESGKKLAIISKKGAKNKVFFEGKYVKLFSCHSDSLGRDQLDGTTKNILGIEHRQGYFKEPGFFSISPGSTCFNFCQNLNSRTFQLSKNKESIVCILNFGTNELLNMWELISSQICLFPQPGQSKYLKKGFCQTCDFNFKNKDKRGFSKRLHVLEHNVTTFVFIPKNRIHKWVDLRLDA